MSDHEVERLLMPLLEARERFIAEQLAIGLARAAIDALLTARGLSYRCIGEKFEVSKGHIWKIDSGRRRCQTVMLVEACP